MITAIPVDTPDTASFAAARFGRAAYFALHNSTTGIWEFAPNTVNLHAEQGAGIQSAARIANLGATRLIAPHIGPKAFSVLVKAGIAVYAAQERPLAALIEACNAQELQQMKTADVEGHW